MMNRIQENERRSQQEDVKRQWNDASYSEVSEYLVEGMGASLNEPYINAAAQHAAPSINHFKNDPPKLFNSKMLNGTALESWLHQMNLYFQIGTNMPENFCVTRAALLLTGNAVT